MVLISGFLSSKFKEYSFDLGDSIPSEFLACNWILLTPLMIETFSNMNDLSKDN